MSLSSGRCVSVISRPSRPIIKEERAQNLRPGEMYIFSASRANNSAYQDEHQEESHARCFFLGRCVRKMAASAHLVRICCGIYTAECKFNLEVKINAESSLSFYGRFYLFAAVFSFIFTLAGSIKFNAEIILFARLNLNHSRPTPARPHLMVLIVIKSGGGTPLIIFVFELWACA